jgi:Arc/MetJ-type ribon-helix-helix transcriptional regulator
MTTADTLAAMLLALALLLSQWLWMADARAAQLRALVAERQRIEHIERNIDEIKGLMQGVALGAGIKKQ